MSKKALRDFFLVVIIGFLIWHFSPAKEIMYQFLYDFQTKQTPVQKHAAIDDILDQYEIIPVQKLDSIYLTWTGIRQPTYQKILANTSFYKIPGKSIFQFLVGDFRVKHFLPHDEYYKYYIRTLKNDTPIYFLIKARTHMRSPSLVQL